MRTPQQKKEYDRSYHMENKSEILARNKRFREEHYVDLYNRRRAQQLKRADEFAAFKRSFGCSQCGFNAHGAALDFHHVDPKTKGFAITNCNWNKPKGEIERMKCEILCANCHRIETATYLRDNPPKHSQFHKQPEDN